ncbi:MAG TPA: site-specific integrase [Planctomycetota bacterium]|nr:site-specific integrase [Planctomycetota bacterium]
MPYVFLDKRKKPYVYRFQYTDHKGRRRTGTGTTSKPDTEQMALIAQAKERAIKRTWAVAPKPSDTPRDAEKVIKEYLAWGESQGGHGGRPWSAEHLKHKRCRLEFWRTRLGLVLLTDIYLPKVEGALRELQEKGRSNKRPFGTTKAAPMTGKSLQNYAEALRSFCLWAKGRGYLEEDPLEGLAAFDTTPKVTRRALTVWEIKNILDNVECSDDRLLFEVALCTGYRRGELAALKVRDFEAETQTLSLPAALTKGRKDARQPLPDTLAAKLTEYVQGKESDAALLVMPKRPQERLYRAMKLANVQRMAAGGKIDFHALRTAYATLAIESGANVKEAQAMLRHSSPALTMNVYAKARNTRLAEVAENIGDKVMESTPFAYKRAVGAEGDLINVDDKGVCGKIGARAGVGSNPPGDMRVSTTRIGRSRKLLLIHEFQACDTQIFQ